MCTRILPSDCLPTGDFVVVAAIVAIRVPVLRAEKVATSASEYGQPDFLPTTGASVYGLLMMVSLDRIGLPGTDRGFGWR